jgi:hypothetical protein
MSDNEATYDHLIRLADAFEAQRDKRVIFLRCYAMMTANMQAALAAGEFHDPEWVRPWLDHFADFYFNALEAYTQRPETAPRVWRLTHELAQIPMTNVIEALLLGVNAHINADLPLALHDALAPEWGTLTPEQRDLRHQDHNHVNAVIGRTTDAVRHEVLERYSHLLCVVDHVCFPAVELGEWELGRIITAWRDAVWNNAVRLVEDADTLDQDFLRYDIESGAIHRMRVLMSTLDVRDHLLGLPIEELRRLHPNPPHPQEVLRQRSAQRLIDSQRRLHGSSPHRPGDASSAPAPQAAEEVAAVPVAIGRRRRWFRRRA